MVPVKRDGDTYRIFKELRPLQETRMNEKASTEQIQRNWAELEQHDGGLTTEKELCPIQEYTER
jgi:hypothetical protein